jgi:hypothetical protein
MKKNIKYLFSLVAIFTLMAFRDSDILCNSSDLKLKAKKILEPYKYDSSELTNIIYKNKETLKEVEVPMFMEKNTASYLN